MKTNTLHFVSNFLTSLGIAILIVVFGAMGTAKAQNTLPKLNQSALNGLFTPTAAQRFFEEGRSNMEREAQILANPERYFSGDLLQINTIDIKLIEETGETKPPSDFSEDSPQHELR